MAYFSMHFKVYVYLYVCLFKYMYFSKLIFYLEGFSVCTLGCVCTLYCESVYFSVCVFLYFCIFCFVWNWAAGFTLVMIKLSSSSLYIFQLIIKFTN